MAEMTRVQTRAIGGVVIWFVKLAWVVAVIAAVVSDQLAAQ